MSSPVLGPHLVRYGFAGDQYLLALFAGAFDELILNAKIVAHMGAGLSAFLLNSLRGKPYVIDPQTYSFQHDASYLESNSRPGQISRTFSKLIDCYGPPLDQISNETVRSLSPAAFAQGGVLEKFCAQVVEFQRTALTSHSAEQDSAKYIRFAERKSGKKIHEFGPSLLVPPYFYLDSLGWQDWLDVNAKAVLSVKAKKTDTDPPIAAQLVLSKDLLLDSTALSRIVKEYAGVKPDAILLWIDSFPEHEASQAELQAFVDLASKLSETAEVVNLYGGFFSELLVRAGILAGVAHGLEYGEDRAVLPIGGGVASARYYMPCLHVRMFYRDALRIARGMGAFANQAAFFEKVCDCQQCRDTITDPNTDFALFGLRKPGKDGKPYPTATTRDICTKHYMHSKKREFESDDSLAVSIGKLQTTLAQMKKQVEARLLAHLSRWVTVLKNQ
jgi:hypothetical protein